MKKLLAILFVSLLIVGCGAPAEAHTTVINNNIDKDNEYGVGADVILHEGADGELLNKAAIEYRYDWNNDDGNHSTYLVGTIKLADAWDKAQSIFNKE